MAELTLSETGQCKTMLVYRAEEGLAIERIDRKAKTRRSIPVTAADLAKLMEDWPSFRSRLTSAGVPNVEPETSCPSGSTASPARGSSGSGAAATQGGLL